MKTIRLRLIAVSGLIYLFTGAGLPAADDADADFKPLFNGRTLDGWKTDAPEYWSVEDGAITGKITKERPLARNLYLVWQGGEVADFELKLQHRVFGSPNLNCGFQFRSREWANHDVAGYQVDNNLGTPWLVRLYDEHGRHTLALRGERATQTLNTPPVVSAITEASGPAWFRLEEWHEYHLICQGPRLTLKVDGRLAAEVTDRDIQQRDLSGILALQLHSGPPTTAQFKNIRYKVLDPNAGALKDKTLVAWVRPANLTQRGGSVLTVDDSQSHFDAIVFGELAPARWMAGSDFHRRTHRTQEAWPTETAGSHTLVQMAITYQDRQITIYRNGQRYAQYPAAAAPQPFGADSVVLIGPRHLDNQNDRFAGQIDDARIYDWALSAEQIVALKPNESAGRSPWAWWTFDGAEIKERTGRFAATRLVGGARLDNGALVLDGRGALLAAFTLEQLNEAQSAAVPASLASKPVLPDDLLTARRLRNQLLADPYRPTYHFVIPEDYASPFDPNGAIFWRGRYHLFYIYQEKGVHCFGHVSSVDMVHWRQHPPALFPTPDSPERGIFSGNCFVNKRGEATMLYHGVNAGNTIATSTDELLERWQKLPGNPIVPNSRADQPYASWDPDGWLEGDTYYAIFGGQPGQNPKPATVFKAKELDQWSHVGPFLHHEMPGVATSEDISCADFFKLAGRRVLVCISHNRGARYYVGDWKNEQFHPVTHERMSWVDNLFFAPESLETPDGRRVMWAWIFDQRGRETRQASGWSGEMSLPRELTLGADNLLRQRPLRELERLRYNEQALANLALADGQELVLEKIKGNALELWLEIEPGSARQCGVKVCRSPGGEEQTVVSYDAVEKKLKLDVTRASLKEGLRNVEAAPFALAAGEAFVLRVFVDRSVVEAFANDRQAAVRRLYPSRPDSLGISLFSSGGAAKIRQLKAWQMAPSNPW